MAGFGEQIDAWIGDAIERRDLVAKEAAQRQFERVLTPRAKGGNMRVDTGFLRASAKVSLDNPVLGLEENSAKGRSEDQKGVVIFPFDEGAISLTINRMEWGQTLWMVFSANYAKPREHKDLFVRSSVALWQDDVDWAVNLVRGRQ